MLILIGGIKQASEIVVHINTEILTCDPLVGTRIIPEVRARRALVDWYLSLFVMCKVWHQYNERLKALSLLNSPLIHCIKPDGIQ